MAKITEYAKVTSFDSGDILLKDGTNGTKTIGVADAAAEFLRLMNTAPINHRNFYRGKYLGNAVTDAQITAIRNGTFEDLWIGDYWTINGVNYVIADINYWYNCGDTALTKPHLIIVTEKQMYTAKMNEENTNAGGYVGSLMYTTNLEEAKTKINAAFPNLVLTHKNYLSNTDKGAAGAWFDSTVELMTEEMVYGHRQFAEDVKITVDKTQLALFALNPQMINIRQTYWLRNACGSASFAIVSSNGNTTNTSASSTSGVRPVFAIG